MCEARRCIGALSLLLVMVRLRGRYRGTCQLVFAGFVWCGVEILIIIEGLDSVDHLTKWCAPALLYGVKKFALLFIWDE